MDKTTKILYLTGMFVTLGAAVVVFGNGPMGVGIWVTLMVAFLWPVLWKRVPLRQSWGTVLAAGVAAGGFVFVFRDVVGSSLGQPTAVAAALVAAPVLVLSAAYARVRLMKNE